MSGHIPVPLFSSRLGAARLDRFDLGARPPDLFHDAIHRRRPHERLGAVVPAGQEEMGLEHQRRAFALVDSQEAHFICCSLATRCEKSKVRRIPEVRIKFLP